MARNVLASEMLARLREATDTQNDTHLSDAELYKKLTAAVASTWDRIQANGIGGEAVKNAVFTTVANQIEYSIASTSVSINGAGAVSGIADFYKVKTLYVSDGYGMFRPVNRVSPNEEYGLRGPASAVSVKLYYIPCAPVWTTGSETFDGINGWEEHAIAVAAVAVKAKKQDDTGPFTSLARAIEERMKTHANRNADEPPRVIRRRAAAAWAARTVPYLGGVGAWDIRGGNIELYTPSIGLYP